MKFAEELNQLIAKHLGPKANLFDYSDAVETLLEAGHRLNRTSFFRIDKAMSSLPFVASVGRFTGYDPG